MHLCHWKQARKTDQTHFCYVKYHPLIMQKYCLDRVIVFIIFWRTVDLHHHCCSLRTDRRRIATRFAVATAFQSAPLFIFDCVCVHFHGQLRGSLRRYQFQLCTCCSRWRTVPSMPTDIAKYYSILCTVATRLSFWTTSGCFEYTLTNRLFLPVYLMVTISLAQPASYFLITFTTEITSLLTLR